MKKLALHRETLRLASSQATAWNKVEEATAAANNTYSYYCWDSVWRCVDQPILN
jgi:hypothetical protein